MAPPSYKSQVEAALPGTIGQLVAKTGFAESTLRRHLNALHKEGKAHIKKRKRTMGFGSPIWVFGPGKNAPQVTPLTNAQYCRRHRRRIKTAINMAVNYGKKDERYARHIALHYADKAAKQGDPLVNALFGRSA